MISRVLIELLDASPKSHASVFGWSHQNQLTWSTARTKCLPIAILSEEIWIKTSLTLLCLPDIRRPLAFQSRQTFSWHIFRIACVRTLTTSLKRSHLVYTRHWTSPNCRILWVYLNTDQKYTLVYLHCSLLGMDSLAYRRSPECLFLPYLAVDITITSPGLHPALKVSQLQYSLAKSVHETRYLIMSSTHPITEGSPEASYVRGTHLPSFIRPYLAVVINTTWSGWHWAVKVSQLQYSLFSPDEKKYLSVCAMTLSFSFRWLASFYLLASNDQISLFCVAQVVLEFYLIMSS